MNKGIYSALLMITFVINSALAAEPIYTRPSDSEIQAKLTKEQYYVTQKKGTERSHDNAYWNNKEPGIYVDIVTGEPLFISTDKYDAKTGWPSFTKPLEPNNIVTQADNTWFTERTEAISKVGRSHLGHVFNDGPSPTNQRWCMNSAALEFIPVKDLKQRGYGKYLPLFKHSEMK